MFILLYLCTQKENKGFFRPGRAEKGKICLFEFSLFRMAHTGDGALRKIITREFVEEKGDFGPATTCTRIIMWSKKDRLSSFLFNMQTYHKNCKFNGYARKVKDIFLRFFCRAYVPNEI